LRLDDFDAVPGLSPVWDERYRQLGRGRPGIDIGVASTPNLQLACVARTPGVFVQGAATGGAAVLAIPLSAPHLFMQRAPWDASLMAYLPPGCAYEVLSPMPHRVLALAVSPALLDGAAMERFGTPMTSGVSGRFLRMRDAPAREGLLRTWTRWISASTGAPSMLGDPAVARQMEHEVVQSLMAALAPTSPLPPLTPHRQLALRAEAYIRDTLAEQAQLRDICDAVDTGPRSLHLSFQKVFGIPPKTYQRALRLDAVRRELLRGSPERTVSETAVRWGFLQLGYFARSYRCMFGESPRETLQRGRDSRGFHPRWPRAGSAARS
jgi:AraC family ethanolamine operon transcriptional activator